MRISLFRPGEHKPIPESLTHLFPHSVNVTSLQIHLAKACPCCSASSVLLLLLIFVNYTNWSYRKYTFYVRIHYITKKSLYQNYLENFMFYTWIYFTIMVDFVTFNVRVFSLQRNLTYNIFRMFDTQLKFYMSVSNGFQF